MDTHTGAIVIARVSRQNSSGLDVRYEQLINGLPQHIPGYTLVEVWGRRMLSEGKTLSSLATGRWLNIVPFPMWLEDVTNVDGVLVRSFGFRPSERAIRKAKKAHAARLAAEAVAA